MNKHIYSSTWPVLVFDICHDGLHRLDLHSIFRELFIVLNHFPELFSNIYHVLPSIIAYRCHLDSSSFRLHKLKMNVLSSILGTFELMFLECKAWLSIFRSIIGFDLHQEFQVLLLLNNFAFNLGNNLNFIIKVLTWSNSSL